MSEEMEIPSHWRPSYLRHLLNDLLKENAALERELRKLRRLKASVC